MKEVAFGNEKISFDFITLPLTSENLLKLSMKNCKECRDANQEAFCLICGEIYCFNCEVKMHVDKHQKTLILKLETGELYMVDRKVMRGP